MAAWWQAASRNGGAATMNSRGLSFHGTTTRDSEFHRPIPRDFAHYHRLLGTWTPLGKRHHRLARPNLAFFRGQLISKSLDQIRRPIDKRYTLGTENLNIRELRGMKGSVQFFISVATVGTKGRDWSHNDRRTLSMRRTVGWFGLPVIVVDSGDFVKIRRLLFCAKVWQVSRIASIISL
jgi:hypothetical protein